MSQPAIGDLRVGDIGGHPLKDGRWFRTGLVYRISGGMVGPAEIAHLDEIGIRVLVDLRGGDENRSALDDWARSRGVTYRHEPIALANPEDLAAKLGGEGVTEADGRAYLGAMYRRMLDEFSTPLVNSVRAIAADQPVAFGCAAGKDRTGILTALVQDLLGVDRGAILAAYVSQAPDPDRLMEAMEAWGDDWGGVDPTGPGVGAILNAVEETMAGTLEHLDERYGGSARYFEAHGLESDTIDLLRRRLVADEPI